MAGIALAVSALRLPAAEGPEAPPDVFSAARARQFLDRIARQPHPVGSDEHEYVREQLLGELARLGLASEQQEGRVDEVPLTNLIVRIPGTSSTGTVLCSAHYDSVPTGPGAGDDGAGVVCWLEALRALRARGWQPRNDVLFLLSDGEELGLEGAKLFAATHPAMNGVSVVLNLEAIGNGGPAVLFQLGPRNGARVREFARAVSAPTGSSLADSVYRRMPNDTDLTVFLRRGIGGFNLALTYGSPAYHAPHDTPGNLDPRSLQHMGECALELLEHVSALDLREGLDAGDVTFFDLLGRELVIYPRWLDLLPATLGVLLALLVGRRARVGWREARGLPLEHVVTAGVRALFLASLVWLLDSLAALFTPRLAWVAGNTTSGALLFAGLVMTVAALETLCAEEREELTVQGTLGALVAWCPAAVLALVYFPGAAFVVAWPPVLAALGLLTVRARSRLLAAAALLLGLTATLLVALPILHMLVQLFQRRLTGVSLAVGFVLASGAALFGPHFRALRRGAPWAGPVLFALGVLALLAAVFVARVLVWRHGSLPL
jgi:hypothetical protein